MLSVLIPQQFGTKETEDESHNGSADDGVKKASSVFLHILIQYFAGICEIHFFKLYFQTVLYVKFMVLGFLPF